MAKEGIVKSGDSGRPGQNGRTKAELQRQMHEARNSISHAVEEIKEAVEGQYDAVKKTVDGVLAGRDQLQKDPIVWSVGALAAGFALGYTLGYTHKTVGRSKGSRSEVGAFVDRLIDELSAVGNSLVMPTLNSKIRDLFGFDFSDMLKEIGGEKSQSGEQTKGRRERQRSTALKVVGQRKRRAGT